MLTFFIFAWITFPGQKAAAILSNKLNTLSDDVEVKISKIMPGTMLTWKTGQSEMIINNKVKLVFGSIRIDLSFFSIFSDNKKGNILFSNIVAKTEKISILKSMEIAELNFTHIDFEFKKYKDKLEVINFDAKGTQCNILAGGNIYFLNKSDKSEEIRLDLQINILPNPLYLTKFTELTSVITLLDKSKQGIKLHISGNLKNPEIKL